MLVSELKTLQEQLAFANIDLVELRKQVEFITIESNIVREENSRLLESELQIPITASVEETTPERDILHDQNARTMQDMCDYFLSLHSNLMISLRRKCFESVHSLHHENVP